jgi:SAM-dependent methyltransferase
MSYLELPMPEDGSFDTVLDLGGSLNYMPEVAVAALAELRRLLRPEGHLLGSVMSAVGALQMSLHAGRTPADDDLDADRLRQVPATGTLAPGGRPIAPHEARMMRPDEIADALHAAGLAPTAFWSTDRLLSLPPERIRALQGDAEMWPALPEAGVRA